MGCSIGLLKPGFHLFQNRKGDAFQVIGIYVIDRALAFDDHVDVAVLEGDRHVQGLWIVATWILDRRQQRILGGTQFDRFSCVNAVAEALREVIVQEISRALDALESLDDDQ